MKLREMLKTVTALPTDSRGDINLSVACGVPKIEAGKSGSYKVSILPSGLKYAIGGYCFENAPFFDIIKKAAEDEIAIILRFEKIRRKNVDINIPIAELTSDMATAKDSVITALVGVYDVGTKSWILEDNEFRPENDPDEIVSAVESAMQGGMVDAETFFKSSEPTISIPNPAGFEKQNHLIDFYYMIRKIEQKHDYELKEETRRHFAKLFLRLSDRLQKEIKGADVVDHKDYSHDRARFLILSYEEIDNLDKESAASIKIWLKKCYDLSIELINWTKE